MKSKLRQAVKMTARRSFVYWSILTRNAIDRRGPCAVRVLTYHQIESNRKSAENKGVLVKDFTRQMEFLAASCSVISTNQIRDLSTLKRARCPIVCITIDDGHTSAIETAAPILKRLNLPATFFIPTGRVGSRGFMSSENIRELSDVGFVIGSHGHSHTPLTNLERSAIRSELMTSRSYLQECTARPVTSFAYPYGTIKDFNEITDEEVRAAGFLTAFTSQHGVVNDAGRTHCHPRIKIERHDSFDMFRRIVDGAMDGWSIVDRHLWHFQVNSPARRKELAQKISSRKIPGSTAPKDA